MEFDYLEKFASKITTSEDLIERLGAFPRSKSIIMCHGVFDVVHPGHIRHLAYAKSKASTLVVSITADKHIYKGTYRPHVPERMRALNLAAYEMVDFVIIDEEPTPLKNLATLKPEYFAKGFEYSSQGLPPATTEEMEVIKAYGGEIIFTPGDLILSSSKLINDQAPDLKLDKVINLMQQEKISFEMLEETLASFENLSVHVVGDTIVDTYVKTNMIGGLTKTPTISLKFIEQERYVGGAGIVALHLRAAGADVVFTSVTGKDELSEYVGKEMIRAGVFHNKIIDEKRPTTEKKVFICGDYRLLKVDTLDNAPIPIQANTEIKRLVADSNSDIVVFSDFRHGMFHKGNIGDLTSLIPKTSLKVADSQVASRWGNITDFKGFDLITPNEKEARFSIADQDSTIGPLAGKLLEYAQCKNLLLKLGERGVMGLKRDEITQELDLISLDSFAESPVDPVGAGDALLAYSCLTLRVTNSLSMAAIIGSVAAACETEKDGNIPVTRDEIASMLSILRNRTGYSIL
jgi:rfaE bifunctional protein kinase chain/domain